MTTTNPTYWLGIDAGGTHSEWVVCDNNEQIIEKMDGPAMQASRMTFAQILDRFKTYLTHFDLSKISGICAGISGLGHQQKIAEMQQALHFYVQSTPLIINSDANITHRGTFMGGDGTLVIAGTGSIVLSRQGDNWFRRGGWGHVIGDPGSGYAIGLHFLRRTLREGLFSNYAEDLNQFTQSQPLTAEDDLLRILYSQSLSPSDLAPYILKRAEEGDSFVEEIVLNEVAELADSVYYIFKNSPSLTKKMALHGGLFRSAYFYSLLEKHILSTFADVEIVSSPKPSALCACRVIQHQLL